MRRMTRRSACMPASACAPSAKGESGIFSFFYLPSSLPPSSAAPPAKQSQSSVIAPLDRTDHYRRSVCVHCFHLLDDFGTLPLLLAAPLHRGSVPHRVSDAEAQERQAYDLLMLLPPCSSLYKAAASRSASFRSTSSQHVGKASAERAFGSSNPCS